MICWIPTPWPVLLVAVVSSVPVDGVNSLQWLHCQQWHLLLESVAGVITEAILLLCDRTQPKPNQAYWVLPLCFLGKSSKWRWVCYTSFHGLETALMPDCHTSSFCESWRSWHPLCHPRAQPVPQVILCIQRAPLHWDLPPELVLSSSRSLYHMPQHFRSQEGLLWCSGAALSCLSRYWRTSCETKAQNQCSFYTAYREGTVLRLYLTTNYSLWDTFKRKQRLHW